MKKIILVFLLLLFLLQTVLAEQECTWTIWSSDGKGDSAYAYKQRPQTTVLENYEYNVLQLHPDLAWIKEQKKKEAFSLKPKTFLIGKLNGHEIYDVFEENYGMKQIVMRLGESEYRILYSLWPADPVTKLEPSRIVPSQAGEKLITKIRLPGKGGGYYHEEFILDTSNNRIINLRGKVR